MDKEMIKEGLKEIGLESKNVAIGVVIVGLLAIAGSVVIKTSKETSTEIIDSSKKIWRIGKITMGELMKKGE